MVIKKHNQELKDQMLKQMWRVEKKAQLRKKKKTRGTINTNREPIVNEKWQEQNELGFAGITDIRESVR